MGAPIVEDELWALIEPLLPMPKPRRKKYPARLPVANRAALNGILFVLKTGIRWRDLSTKLGFGLAQSAGDGCATGRRRVCGSDCTNYCWRSYAR
ncbi:transposase [Caballeronia sp. AZ7_KS35]|uniref:transposase n=1 Tax=Caballeronia sp. AZ7_KS35 TaxID=2921762 RepID=UPI002028B7B9|nr:transposase [Caballeronia sp. AZ7_KS35]